MSKRNKKRYKEKKKCYLIPCANPECDAMFEVTAQTFNERIRKGRLQLCPECMQISSSKKRSKAQIERFARMTPEEKEEYGELISQGMNDMTLEAKERMIKNNSAAQKKRMKDPNEREKYRQAGLRFWDSVDETYRKHHGELVSDGMSKMTPEAKEKMIKNESKGQLKRYANETLEQKEKRSNINSVSGLEFYKNLSYNDKLMLNRERCKTFNKHQVKLFGYMPELCLNDIKYKTEKDFMNLLIENNINFIWQYYNLYPYPNFKELFPYNIHHDVDYVSPFHRWDFYIQTKKTNIFIDIDGSIHDPTQNNYPVTNRVGNKISMTVIQKFVESQRKYQTDNLPAYIIKCFDGKLTLDSNVENVYNKDDTMLLKDLLNLIYKYNKK